MDNRREILYKRKIQSIESELKELEILLKEKEVDKPMGILQLSKGEVKVLSTIIDLQKQLINDPSHDDVAMLTGITRARVKQCIKSLKEKGCIEVAYGVGRGFKNTYQLSESIRKTYVNA